MIQLHSLIIISVHDYPESIDPEKRKRMLLLLDLENMSKKVIVSEEALVYNSKDLLAWIGGALGVFVGYSFFNLSQHIIDGVSYFLHKVKKKTSQRRLRNTEAKASMKHYKAKQDFDEYTSMTNMQT